MSSSISADPNCRVGHQTAESERLWLTMCADYFTKLLEDDLKAVVKPQYVDQIPRAIRAADKSVKALLDSRASLGNMDEVMDTLGMAC